MHRLGLHLGWLIGWQLGLGWHWGWPLELHSGLGLHLGLGWHWCWPLKVHWGLVLGLHLKLGWHPRVQPMVPTWRHTAPLTHHQGWQMEAFSQLGVLRVLVVQTRVSHPPRVGASLLLRMMGVLVGQTRVSHPSSMEGAGMGRKGVWEGGWT